MKRKILIAFLFIPFLIASCEGDNYGYPSKMTFEREGGTKICSGTSSFYCLEINNYNGIGAADNISDTDSIKVTYDWLTIKCKKFTDSQLKMIAAPNPSGKKRTLYVYGHVNDSFAEIKVEQY